VGTPDYQVNIFRQQVQNGETFSADLAGFSGGRLISSFSPIDSTGWYYVISVPTEIVYTERHEVVVLSLIMVIGVVLVVAALAGITVYTAREELLAKAQAEVRSNFLNNMSHELRTPLNSLIGLNYLMRENLDDPEKLEQYLEKENETASYLKNLVDDVLDVSKLQAKGVKLELAPVDLNELLTSISDMVQISVEEKGLEYICDCHFERPLVMLDEVRVKQILMNILGNALKFTDHGSVRFEARQAFYVGSNTVSTVFSVTDTGCGISEEFLPHVFDAFEQEEGKVGAYLKGTGLGMPISKMLAEQMGGRIMVSSVEGKGTCFVVDLPAECVDEAPEVVDADKAEVRLAPNAGVCGCESGVRAALQGAVSGAGAGAGAGAECVTGNMASGLVLGAQSDGEGSEGCVASSEREAVTGGVGEGAVAADTADAAAEGNGERRILLAEDNELNALIMSEILRGAGFTVMVATDGGQTVRLFEKMPVGYFDLVLVDWQMPVYDGITATRLIRSLDRPDAATVPIFMCTANATQENKEEAMANGMTAFLSKPIDVKEVLSLLNSVGQ
jgi:signal transduction histidine kinase/ActR/RegA family two-component response regulator